MPVTKPQAQLLAALAVACRPTRAPTWDEAGVVANIAKVADRSLAEVALAVIKAASDRECVSPGVIPSNGSHWQEQLKPEKWAPERVEPGERCGTCGLSQPRCVAAPHGDHAFEPDFKLPRDLDLGPVVAELKGHLPPKSTPLHATTKGDTP